MAAEVSMTRGRRPVLVALLLRAAGPWLVMASDGNGLSLQQAQVERVMTADSMVLSVDRSWHVCTSAHDDGSQDAEKRHVIQSSQFQCHASLPFYNNIYDT